MSCDLPIFPDKWNLVQLRRKLCGIDGIRIGPFGSALTLDQMVEEGFKVYGQENVIAQDFTAGTRFLSPTKYSELKACSISSGDLLVTMMGTTGRCCVVPEGIAEGIMDSHLIRLRFKNREVDSSFMALLVDKGHYVKEQIAANGKGTIMSGLNSTIIKDVWVGLPDLKGQRIISKYLDEQTAKVDRLMEMRRRQIDLLNEHRAAFIQRAVTRGLNPDAPMKDSGIPWLGEIPAHWKLKKLKYLAKFKSGENITSEEIDEIGEYPVFGGNGLRGYTDDYTHEGKYVLIGRQGALCGNINYADGKFWASEHAVVAALIPKNDVCWFGELLRVMNLNQYSQSAAQPGLAVDKVQNLIAPVPPITEQTKIVNHIEQESRKIEKLVVSYTQQITLLTEYRSSLIHECVTGQRLLNNPSMANGENNEYKSRTEAN